MNYELNIITTMRKLLILIGAVLIVAGCKKKEEAQTPISGYITVRGSEQTLPMMMEQAYAFMDLYSKAKILVVGGGSNVGLAALFMDSAQVAVSTRPMTAEEKQRAADLGFKMNEFKICRDGIAVVINPQNSVRKLTIAQVRGLFTGAIKNWSRVGGPNLAVKVHVWNENSGTFSFLRDSILLGEEYRADAWQYDNTEDIIKSIQKNKGGIGIISMARLYTSWSPLLEDARIVAVALAQSPEEGFVEPDEATVHAGTYPLSRYIYLYTAHEALGLDAGFISFIMASPGQKIIAANGFVPITVPVKYVGDTL
jgi:phosphate transport system substrate-binding protein